MTKQTIDNNQLDNFDDLDALFAQVREEEPELDGDNFSKIVVNQLPNKVRRNSPRRVLSDFFGLTLGALLAYSLVDFSALYQRVEPLLPTSGSISLMSVLVLAASFSLVAATSWWIVERNN